MVAETAKPESVCRNETVHSCSIQTAAISVSAENTRLTQTSSIAGNFGATSSFCGVVRRGGRAQKIKSLWLEHYPGMTEAVINQLQQHACNTWQLQYCRVVHRVGELSVGEIIVLILCASQHRQDAMAATGFLIDWLKTRAPFWKRESYQDGSEEWIQPTASDHAQTKAWLQRLKLDVKQG